ncbi:hypothetical protein J7E81_02950 [Bacillus sp. ISL-18]|uniref:hypothetical protein n=1 Tax=Bacillus sp. ISL-18 TaxID=2819118 RepID=UPI001BEA8CF1|nr:hypothetical protein [Bacillus sp. ISL-18]MBT2654202.1 hypothetical protein [Bacillus sp. ISL-18]
MEDVTKLNLDAYGEDFIPQGFFIINGDDVFPTRIRNRIIVNRKDLIHSGYYQDISRLNVVAEKMDVSEMSDCWQPHLVALDPNLLEYSFEKPY